MTSTLIEYGHHMVCNQRQLGFFTSTSRLCVSAQRHCCALVQVPQETDAMCGRQGLVAKRCTGLWQTALQADQA